MQNILPRQSKNSNSNNKKVAIILVVISTIGYFALFTSFIKFLKVFLIGFFGLFAYPLFFIGYAVSYMILKGKKFVLPKKFVVYCSLAIFSILCIFHIAFSGFVTMSSYGAYLAELYTCQMSVGGLLLGLITYPLLALLQNFGTYVLFVLLLIFSCYKIVDYFLVNKNSKNYVGINKNGRTRIEEVKVSSSASQFLNEQLFEEKKVEPKITVDAEIEKENQKREEAKAKLGLIDVKNKPVATVNKQLDTFERVYNNQHVTPIFEENESENIEDELKKFNPFNNATFSHGVVKEDRKKDNERNLEFLNATLNTGYKVTSEDYARMKRRNLNLEDNLKNLPINNLIKEAENKSNETQNEKDNVDFVEKSEQQENIRHNEEKEDVSTNKKDKISDIKIDDIINKVSTIKTEEVKEKNRYVQANILNDKPAPKLSNYKKPSKYVRPTLDLLNTVSSDISKNTEEFERNARIIETTLENFKVPAKVIGVVSGPAVTRYELEMPAGISVNKISQFSSDLKMALASRYEIRIEAPIPGKSAVGVEVPNKEIATVSLREILESKEFYGSKGVLTFALGKDINGNCRVCNIEKMPHLLVAGSTGSGKSVCLNVLLVSLLYKCGPDDLRILLVDPKRVEFSMFNNLPHLLIPEVIYSSDKTINALSYLIKEMERRYGLFEETFVKKIDEYNQTQEVANGTREKLPYIIMIIDEMNDLMSSNKKEIEDRVLRIAQKARAAGIHLILATQRPSVDVITGTIKNNLPSRIAFAVQSSIDSRTILDRNGAEKLLGRGDMLYYPQELPEPSRIQCAYVSNEEVMAVVNFVKQNNECYFSDEADREINKVNESSSGVGYDPNEVDSLMSEAVKYVIEIGQASISKLQRRFGIGFSRAGKIIDQMERLRYISPADGSKPRTVYITMEEYIQIYGE